MNAPLRLLVFVALLFVTLPLTAFTIFTRLADAPSTEVLSANTTVPVISRKDRLSCSDCLQQGKDGICFNVESKTAYCGSSKNATGLNVLCRSCGSITPSVLPGTPTPPPGCYYKHVVCTRMCPVNSPNCCGNQMTLVCPSGIPIPSVTCTPRPACLYAIPSCKLPEPAQGWCPRISPLPVGSGTGIQSSLNK